MEKFCKKHVNIAKAKYYSSYLEEYKENSRKQWELINSLLNRNKKKGNINKLIDKDGTVINTPSAIAEHFNEYFSNIATTLKNDINNRAGHTESTNGYVNFLRQPVQNSIYIRKTNPQEIFEVIKKLKNKSTLDTKINALKIANSSHSFTNILARIINRSFEEGIFPHQLKNARVIPVYKGSSKTDVSNYRPISLLSVFSKIYEKLMHTRIADFLELNGSLHDMQYGFRQGRSCEQALLKAQNILLDSLNRNKVSLLLLIDFSKAFDMVEHSILLRKLEHYGIRGVALKWIESYLSDRMQFVSVSGVESSAKQMKYGVPQGSILGPLLFIIYINDIPNLAKFAQFILYADDANIILTGNSIAEVNQQLCELRKDLIYWVDCNGLALNLKKTNYIIFSRKRTERSLPSPFSILDVTIEQKTEARFLGIIIDENFTWAKHISAIRSKMSRYIGVMYKLKRFLPLKSRLQIYHSFVQSHIQYCSLVWGFCAKSHIETLFRSQKKAMRAVIPGYINYKYKKGITAGHTKSYFKKINVLTVHGVIVMNALLFLHKTRHFPRSLPESINETINKFSPVPGDDPEDYLEWSQKFNNHIFSPSVFFKGPLLTIIPQISEQITPPCLLNYKIYKSNIRRKLLEIQSNGNEDDWLAENFLLYNITGFRKTSLKRTHAIVSYQE